MGDYEPHDAPPIGVAQRPVTIREKLMRSQRRFSFTRLAALLFTLVVIALLLHDARDLHERDAPLTLAAYQAMAGVEQSNGALRGFLLTGAEEYRAQRERAWTEMVEPAQQRLRRGLQETSMLTGVLANLAEAQTQLETARARPDWSLQAAQTDLAEMEAAISNVRSALVSTTQTESEALLQSSQRLATVAITAMAVVLLVTVISFFISLSVVRQVERTVIQPVEVLAEGAAQLAAGQLREDLPANAQDELGMLAKSLNRLRVSLALSEMKYRSLFANTSNSMVLLEALTLQISDVNRSFEELTGLKRKQLLQKNVLELFDNEQKQALEEGIKKALQEGQHQVSGIMLTTPARLMVVLEVRITSIQVSAEKVLELAFIDVTEQYIKNQALSEIAFKDELTGLFNHRSFYQRLNEEIEYAKENERSLVLLFVDLDNFKKCNDTYGHQIGDQLLRNVGQLVREHIRQDRDAGFRYGGDEFAVLLPDARVNVAERIAHQVREGFDSIEQFGTSMSIGVAQWKPGWDGETLVKAADEALYSAKSAGKNTVHISQ